MFYKGKEIKTIGIIGARSGSKGVKDKNIRPLLGKPLMCWVIEAAQKAKLVDRVLVSTDSQKYAEIAQKCGAEVPFLRPKEIAGDTSTDFEYIQHALDWFSKKENYIPDIVLRLVPTAPLQQSQDIDSCVEVLLSDPAAHSAMVVAEAYQHPNKAFKITPDGKYLIPFIETKKDASPLARQSYEKAYFRANVIATRYEVIKKMNSLVGTRIRYYIIPRERAIDIDSELDFKIAEILLKGNFSDY